LRRILLLVTAGALLLGTGAAAQQAGLATIEPGQTSIFDFAGEQPIELSLDDRGTALIRVRNIGRDSVLTVSHESGQRILRSAGWRNREHHYYALVDLAAPVRLSIEPDDPVSPAGQLEVRVEMLPRDDPMAAAERAMTSASNLNLAYYYGEADARRDALAGFEQAARLFEEDENRSRQADALFEAANVNDILCERAAAHKQFEQAREIWSELGDERGVAATENLRGLVHWGTGNGEAAMALFNAAADRRERLGDDFFYAEAVNNLGLVHRDRGDARLAEQYFRAALDLWQGDADVLSDDIDVERWRALDKPPSMRHTLTALLNIGWASEVFGDISETEQTYRRALELTDHLSNDFTAATLQNNLGNLKRKAGDMAEALHLLSTSLNYFTEVSPDDYWASKAFFNLGLLHRDLGDATRARQAFEQSLELRTPQCDPVHRAITLKEIAEIEVGSNQLDQALRLIEEGQELLRPYPGNAVTEARLKLLQGRVYLASGRVEESISVFGEAIKVYQQAGDRYGELKARAGRAGANSRMGSRLAVVPELRAALELARQVDSKLEQFRLHTALGDAYLVDGDAESALEAARRAIDLSESVRKQLVLPILLRDFASVQRGAYDVLVRAHLLRGGIEDAWQASDAGRARRFHDVIRQSEIDLSLLDPGERDRYQFLLSAVAGKAEARTEMLVRNQDEAANTALQELLPMIDELDQLQARARRPGTARDTGFDLASLQQILGQSDVVLEFHAGPSMAGAWTISRDSVSFTEIPNLNELAEDIGSIRLALRQRQPDLSTQLDRFARKILISPQLKNAAKGRLIVVPDGPLHYVPFAALPDPATDWLEPLVVSRTVSYLPSIAALPGLRQREESRAQGIAILADPIFGIEDPRVRRDDDPESDNLSLAFLGNELLRSAERTGIPGFARLPATLEEARAIEDAAREMAVLPLYGADANRDAVMSGTLNSYRILHFATHGVLDDVEPALSGVVLSAVTQDGQKRDSFLRSQDIVGLNLDAELVVLSGCETGLGRPVFGEGLVGLSRAFFYAGAEQVISTLWQVPDTATAELMGGFYRALLQDGATVPDALRLAQLEIRKDARWSNPYYWAPFVLQGDWD